MSLYTALLFLLVSEVLVTRASRDGPPGADGSRAGARRKRQECRYGDYNHKDNICCSCPAGEYVEKHCTQNNPTSTKCLKCDEGFYTASSNSLESCERCRSCNENLLQEVEINCTYTKNAECKCMEGHYCAEHECKSCLPCDKCDGRKIVQPCTNKSNTICERQDQRTDHSTAIAVAFAVLIILIALLSMAWCIWKKKCTRGPLQPPDEPDEYDKMNPLLRDIDLSPHLYTIVDELGHKTVKELAIRSGIAQATIDMHVDSYPNNIREQCYNILKDWYERQGLENACNVLNNELRKMGQKTSADKLIQTFSKHVNKNKESA
ncbi:tumor necrosis factor receptor superfamily member 6 [Scleropages formosus]|uniref:Tumor necrosis factor receptor superfamily member 6 n=1 Tax=Scleropages formosus TaxID=113540 RepID=A0A8D0CMV2_SCLFO|nr:tumor necrosis factor receptor superfamily member 6 [Scleropages formosus]